MRVKYTKEMVYNLLPAIYRQRDSEVGKPLKDLLEKITEQLNKLEKNTYDLYNNHFIETCEEWIVPYIADLLGIKILYPVSKATFSHRSWVANTIKIRRAKGTLFAYEQLAHDVTDWPSVAVEFFQILGMTQNVNHLRLSNIFTPNLTCTNDLEVIDSPFDKICHIVDVRNISRIGKTDKRNDGWYNIQNIGIFLWRLQAYPVVDTRAYKHGDELFSCSQIGIDIPLFNHPVTETSVSHLAEEINIPVPIRRNVLRRKLNEYYANETSDNSIRIVRDGMLVNVNNIVVCDLTNWSNHPPAGKVALDPELGRISFPVGDKPTSVYTRYYYGFGSEIGGGFYERSKATYAEGTIPLGIVEHNHDIFTVFVSKDNAEVSSLSDAIAKWESEGKPNAIFEISDSDNYELTKDIAIPDEITLHIRSRDTKRPIVFNDASSINVGREATVETAHEGGRLILEGLLIEGKGISIKSSLRNLTVIHCTIVPKENSSSIEEIEDILDEDDTGFKRHPLSINLERSIVGRIKMGESTESELTVSESIVDGEANNHTILNPAISCYKLSMEKSTVIGSTDANTIKFASNSIFTGIVTTLRRQIGCIRFCYLPYGSRTPKKYRCQPGHRVLEYESSPLVKDNAGAKIVPVFTSKRYGDPGYAQLGNDCPNEIFEGGDNGAEMGVFNHLLQPQRIKNLTSTIDEYNRVGLEIGVFLVS